MALPVSLTSWRSAAIDAVHHGLRNETTADAVTLGSVEPGPSNANVDPLTPAATKMTVAEISITHELRTGEIEVSIAARG